MTIHTVFQIMSQNQAVKAVAMNSFKQKRALTDSLVSAAYDSTTPEKLRIELRALIQNSYQNAYRQLRSGAKLSAIPVNQQISALQHVPLADKRKLLDAMSIIPVSVGAAFLGIAATDLHHINSQGYGVFGDMYMRRRCNSMNELLLIAQNPGWLPYRSSSSPALVSPDSSVLDSITYVDIWTAAAYTDMKWYELKEQVQANGRSYRYDRTYRLSDLEEIRRAKIWVRQ